MSLTLITSIPHRALFGSGVLATCAMALWWLHALAHPGTGSIPPVMLHALLMPLGAFPLFMWGFVFTAGPRWLGVDGPTRMLPLALGYVLGLILCLSGWLAPGLGLMSLSWAWVLWLWLGCIRQSQAQDRWHARIVWGALALGLLGLLLAQAWVWLGDARWWIAARQLLTWGLLMPVFLTVGHRMIPFFTQSAVPGHTPWRPYPLLAGWLTGCALMGLGGIMNWPWLQGPVAALMAASLLYTSWRWGLRASLGNRLLAMLHLSFAWFGIGMALWALSAPGWISPSAGAHALLMGGFLTLLMGFVTRVTLGHSGRPLAADGPYWAIYLSLHVLALARVIASVVNAPTHALMAIALLWLLALICWAARVLPIYWRPRLDGKPG
jgi:uncharacterized protein involved in response to NO